MPAVPPKQTRWKKGQSGNPQGGKKHSPEMKKIRNLTEQEMIEIGSLVLKGSVDELRVIAKDGTASALKCMMAAVAVRTISKGDPHALEVLLNRLIGKVKERLDVNMPQVDSVQVRIMLPDNGRSSPDVPEDADE